MIIGVNVWGLFDFHCDLVFLLYTGHGHFHGRGNGHGHGHGHGILLKGNQHFATNNTISRNYFEEA